MKKYYNKTKDSFETDCFSSQLNIYNCINGFAILIT